ncbi:hypothetical protein QZM91_08280 [Burkholderia multivorans]|nr:hypothetical protein [Burkholderia multivorans]
MTTAYSAEVRYHPWVGDRYSAQQERWLILGESSYALSPTDANATREMILAHCGAATVNFDTGIYRVCAGAERLVTGRDTLDAASRKEFWRTVAFYNYVNDSMPSRQQRPTAKQFRDSLRAFNDVVCQTQPHVVLVLGLRLWMALPGERDGWTKGIEQDIVMPIQRSRSRKLSVWTGMADGKTTTHRFVCFPVVHPSTIGFAASAWRDWMIAAKRTVATSCL